jgi:hypothetical protein
MHGFLKWRESLNVAASVNALEEVMRAYVETLAPLLVALPDDCRRALVDPFDIQSAAVTLMQAELRFDGPVPARELLHEAAYAFASAAVRIAQLHVAPRAPGRATSRPVESPMPPAIPE